jgi:hypothetical protein
MKQAPGRSASSAKATKSLLDNLDIARPWPIDLPWDPLLCGGR